MNRQNAFNNKNHFFFFRIFNENVHLIAIYDRKNYSTKNDTRMPLFFIDKIKIQNLCAGRKKKQRGTKNYTTMQFFFM